MSKRYFGLFLAVLAIEVWCVRAAYCRTEVHSGFAVGASSMLDALAIYGESRSARASERPVHA